MPQTPRRCAACCDDAQAPPWRFLGDRRDHDRIVRASPRVIRRGWRARQRALIRAAWSIRISGERRRRRHQDVARATTGGQAYPGRDRWHPVYGSAMKAHRPGVVRNTQSRSFTKLEGRWEYNGDMFIMELIRECVANANGINFAP